MKIQLQGVRNDTPAETAAIQLPLFTVDNIYLNMGTLGLMLYYYEDHKLLKYVQTSPNALMKTHCIDSRHSI